MASTDARNGPASPTARDRDVARALADQVRRAEQPRWEKVTALLDRFGVSRLTPESERRLSQALEDANISPFPALNEVERSDRILLWPKGGKGSPELEELLTVTEWRADGEVRESLTLNDAASAEGVVWIDVDNRASPEALQPALAAIFGDEVTPEKVRNLLKPDPVPDVRHVSEDVRAVSSVKVVAEERATALPLREGSSVNGRQGIRGGRAATPDAQSRAGDLVLYPMEFLAANSWLVSCRHPPEAIPGRGPDDSPEREPVGYEQLSESAKRYWRESPRDHAGDLGVLLLYELSMTYTKAARVLYSWLETWERAFENEPTGTETRTLIDLRAQTASFRQQLMALRRSAMAKNHTMIWFPDVSHPLVADWVDERIDRALDDLRNLGDSLRASVELVTSVTSSEESNRSQSFQNWATFFASVLLGPTLVATIFGVDNDLLSGVHLGGLDGGAAMAVIMGASAVLSWLLLWPPLRRRATPPVFSGNIGERHPRRRRP